MAGTKRKAPGSVDLPKARAGEAPPSPAVLAMRRERIKSNLLTFPEAAALDELQLYHAVDRVIRESTPSTATPTAQGMVRLDDKSIIATFEYANWLLSFSADDYPPAGVDPLVWLSERRRMLDGEMKPEKKRDDPDNSRFLVAKMRVDLLTKGYVELPRPYVDYTPPPPTIRARGQPKNATAMVVG
ncbi:hypothetical protein VPH35_118529 [Triticum aestivum]